MVTITLIEKRQNSIRWYYNPEDDHTKKPGIIEINPVAETINIIEKTKKEIYSIPASELNEVHDSFNQMRLENGESLN